MTAVVTGENIHVAVYKLLYEETRKWFADVYSVVSSDNGFIVGDHCKVGLWCSDSFLKIPVTKIPVTMLFVILLLLVSVLLLVKMLVVLRKCFEHQNRHASE